ncbi:MAG: GNAT family N-acetyltransferase [Cyclobacteriaceae bacterium]|nr:GNAT family N-acetyltransferase [Cyclobacteriaceae bacterium]UYN85163.1 MAG: GNAT family N-acetyltransferase [Cyclobacteriaceae bacterium]
MERKLVLQENDLTIWKYHGIPEEGIAFFNHTNWGSAGTVYERKNSNELIRLLKDPYLYAIEQNNVIVGTAVFCHTQPLVAGQPYNCYIIRYFAAGAAIQGKKIIKHFAGKVMEVVREDETEKTIYVGCVEKGNIRSYKVVENAGYEKLGLLQVQAFSRFFPKEQKDMEQISATEKQHEVLTLLQQHYKDHALFHTDYLFLKNNYFVIRENDEIVAGCQYHRVHWAINQMPGIMGKIIMNILPRLPLINKLFNPKRFEFLAFEGLHFKPGYEKTLLRLFEGLLHREKINSSLFWMAENCPYRKSIVDYGKLGLLNSFVKDSGVYIMTSYKHLDEKEIGTLQSKPLYASAFDYI